MAEDRMYLTVGREKRKPEGDGYIAVITQGQPQMGDEKCTILAVKVVKNMKAANAWYDRMRIERPWLKRN